MQSARTDRCNSSPASPSRMQCSSGLESSGRFSQVETTRDLLNHVVPLLRVDGEIREVAITALGLLHPNAFG